MDLDFDNIDFDDIDTGLGYMDYDASVTIVAKDPLTNYLFRAWLVGKPDNTGRYLVQRIGVEGRAALAYVYEYKFDNIGDPIEVTGSNRIVFLGADQYAPNERSPPGVCYVYGPCPRCARYYTNYQRHIDEEYGVWDGVDLSLFGEL